MPTFPEAEKSYINYKDRIRSGADPELFWGGVAKKKYFAL